MKSIVKVLLPIMAIFVVLIAACAVFISVPTTEIASASVHYTHEYENGVCQCGEYEKPNTKEFVYQIENAGQYLWLVNYINANTQYTNSKIEFTADIDFSGLTFVELNNFDGTIDGKGHKIKNLTLTATTGNNGIIKSAKNTVNISNLILDSSNTFSGNGATIGGLIGKTENNTTLNINNVGIEANFTDLTKINSTTGYASFVGYTTAGTNSYFTNCYFNGSIKSNTYNPSYVKVFIGSSSGSQNSQYTNCYANPTLTNFATSNDIWSPTSGRTFDNCYLLMNYITSTYTGLNANVNNSQFTSGAVAFMLGGVFGQEIGVDLNPVINGKKIYDGDEACGSEYSNATHEMGAWLASEDNKHYKKCNNCDYTDSHGSHEGNIPCQGEVTCTTCSFTYGPLTHNYENGTLQESGEGHVIVCEYGCGTVKEDSYADHVRVYAVNTDGTHTVSCECGYEKTVSHDFSNLLCECGIYEESKKITEDTYEELGVTSDYVGYYYVDTNSKYQWFVDNMKNNPTVFNTENIYLGNDITTSAILADKESNPYNGIIDGGGNTINFNFTATKTYSSLFGYLNNSSIRNLNVASEINTDYNYVGVLITKVIGTVNVDSVIVKATINSGFSIRYLSGLAVTTENAAVLNVSNCGVNVTFTSTTGGYWGGYLAYNKSEANFDNSYVNFSANTSVGSSVYPISYNLSTAKHNYNNVYYYKNHGTVPTDSQVISVSESDVTGGKLAAILGKPFGQNVDNGQEVGAYPIISDARVYVGYHSCGENDISNITHTTDNIWLWEADYHYQTCANCDEKAFYEACSGQEPTCTDLGTCEVCENKYGTLQHSHIIKYDNNNHWEECEHCGEKINVFSHVFDTFVKGETNHEKSCECGYSKEEDHIYDNGICACGALLAPTLITVDNYLALGTDMDYLGYYAIVNGGNFAWAFEYASKNYNLHVKVVLLNDITYAEDYIFSVYKGNYRMIIDGNGHSISGINITKNYLIDTAYDVTIKNILFLDFSINTSESKMALVNSIISNGTLTMDNVVINGEIKTSYHYDGGYRSVLVAYLYGKVYVSNVVLDIIGSNLDYALFANITPKAGMLKNVLVLVRSSETYSTKALMPAETALVVNVSNVITYEKNTQADIASGRYTYLINRGGTTTIGQQLGVDSSPTISNYKVYCDGTQYTNTESACEEETCSFCGLTSAHVHAYSTSYDSDYHYAQCGCLHIDESTKAEHTFTDLLCSCGYTYVPDFITVNNYATYGLSSEYIGYVAVSSMLDFEWAQKAITINATDTLKDFKLVLVNDVVANENVLDDSGNLNSGSFDTYYGLGYRPSSTYMYYFDGIIDGNGHTLSGLYNANSTGGLVNCAQNLIIRNITIEDFYFYGSFASAISYTVTNLLVENVVMKGRVNNSNSIIVYTGNTSTEITVRDSLFDIAKNNGSYYFSYGNSAFKNIVLENSIIYATGNLTYATSPSEIYNSYSIGSRSSAFKFLKEDFESGKVAYIMRMFEPTTEWGQTIGTNLYPIKDGATVYCNGESFTNTESYCTHLGYCENCGYSNVPTLTTDKYDLDGDGNYDEVYELASYGNLRWFQNQINYILNLDINAILINDIAVNPDVIDEEYNKLTNTYTTWLSIGKNSDYAYKGMFDGNGHRVSGLYKNDYDSTSITSLFAYTNGARIANLTIDDAYLYVRNSASGVVYKAVNTIISNCHFDGYLYANNTFGITDTAGIVSIAENSIIINCSVNGKYKLCSSNSYCGAIVSTLTNSMVDSCLVLGKNLYTSHTASIAGTITNSTIKNCVNFSNDTDFVCIQEGTNTIIKNAYISTESTDFNGYTESEFASGLVAYEMINLLGGSSWGQTIGVDSHPVLNGDKVYCNGTAFTNTESSCVFTDGQCENCKRHEPASFNTTDYDLDGDGNKDEVYLIDSVTDLLWFADYVNIGNYDINGILTVSLDLDGVTFMPIGASSPVQGNYSAQYSGIFDGTYHEIKNLTLDFSSDYTTGLFGNVVGGTIKNLGILNANIKNTTSANSGILAGSLTNATVHTVYTDGTLSATNAYGLSATANGSTLTNVLTSFTGLTKDATSVTNGYYINNKAIEGVSGTFVTASEMRSGKYAYVLNGNSSTDVIWKQTVGNDLFPTFNGSVVYLTENCYGENIAYANTESEVVHVYDGVCDNICNNPECMHERAVSVQHTYNIIENNATHHWHQCSECGYKRDITQHVYDNACDTLCNEVGCNYVREVEDHIYVFSHDETHHFYACENCGLLENASQKQPHNFDNDCDNSCKEELCTYVREVPNHDYQYFVSDTQHAYACANCGTLDTLEEHNFVNGICMCEFNQVPAEVDGYYQIANAGNLLWFAQYVNEGNVTANAKLISNVNLLDIEWTPIASDTSNPYKGTFDGNGYEITNLTFVVFNDTARGGVFANVRNALITNLGVRNATITRDSSTSMYTALIAGYALDSEFVNVYAYGTITSSITDNLGAIIGRGENNLIEYCITNYSTLVGVDSKATYYKSYLTSDFTAEELSSGYVTALLNKGSNKNIWRQTLGSDAYPILRGSIVYPIYNNCGHIVDGYSNVADTDIPDCDYEDGICEEVVGEKHYKAAVLNSNNYYEIKSVSDLMWFNLFVNSGNYNANAILLSDIDLDGFEWIPLARTKVYNSKDGTNNGYTGTFDGNNHVVTNVTVNGEKGSIETNGFFGTLSGTVKNFGIENFILNENNLSKTNAGAIAGQVLGSGKLIRTYAVNVTIYLSSNTVGGLVGALYGGSIENSYSHKLTLTGAYALVGGLIGAGKGDEGGRKGTITNSYSDMQLCGSNGPTWNNVQIVATEAFATGEATYFFNENQNNVEWFQNLVTDQHPKLSGDVVYKAYVYCGDTMWYSNIENAQYIEPQPHVYDENGICTQVEGELHYQEASVNSDGYYEINNVGNYIWLVNDVNLNAREINLILMDDIDLSPYGNVMFNTFSGIFDGNNHVITIDFEGNDNQKIGLILTLSNATVKNLVLQGSLVTDWYHVGPLASIAHTGVVNVTNVIVDVDVTNVYNSTNDYTGGVIGTAIHFVSLNMTNVLYIGTIKGKNTHGGLVGYAQAMNNDYAKIAISNSVSIILNPDDATGTNINTIVYDKNVSVCLNNVYYLNQIGSVQSDAIKINANDITSGKLAYLLNGNSSEGTWRQTIGVDSYPNFVGSKVYAIGENCSNISYSNVEGSIGQHVYNESGICHCGKYESATLNENNAYEINNVGQLYWFAEFVNSGNYSANAILMADIDLDGYGWEPIGKYNDMAYTGTFDGNKYVLSNVKIIRKAPDNIVANNAAYGIFGYLDGTIKNLGIEKLNFNHSLQSPGYVGGIVGMISSNGQVLNCYVVDSVLNMNTSVTSYVGGIAGATTHVDSIINSFAFNNVITNQNYHRGGIYGYNSSSALYATNSYSDLGISPAYKTEEYLTSIERFNSGEVAYLLNGSVTNETNVWGQIIGADGEGRPAFLTNSALVYYRQIGGCSEENIIYGYGNTDEIIVSHTDANSDTICDYCSVSVNSVKMTTGKLVQHFVTLEDALKVVESGSVITIIGNIAVESITIPQNVTLIVNSSVTFTFEELVNEGTIQLIGNLSGTTLKGDGQYYISITNQTLTVDNVVIKDGYTYTGKDLSADIKLDAYLKYEVVGVDFIVDNFVESFSGNVVNVGTYDITFSKDSNLSIFVTASVEVIKADLVIKANDHTINYKENATNNGVTYNGLVGNDTESVLSGELVYTYGEYVNGSEIGTYVISVSGLSATNYNVIFENGTLTVSCGNPHFFDENHVCESCGYVCEHIKYTDTICDECGFEHVNHVYKDGFCNECGFEHENHVYENALCECGLIDAPTLVTEENYLTLNLTQDYVGYYAIEYGYQFLWFARLAYDNSKISAVLISDIDLAGIEWEGIAKMRDYEGTIDGRNHFINNLTLTGNTAGKYGLIGSLYRGATIRDFTINGTIDVNITENSDTLTYVGLVGRSSLGGKIINVHSDIDITVNSVSTAYVGGLLAYNSFNFEASTSYIENSSYSGTITANGKGIVAIGGIFGFTNYSPDNNIYKSVPYLTMTDCVFNGEIVSDSTNAPYVGGLVGYHRDSFLVLKNNLVLGNIDVVDETHVGAIAGHIGAHQKVIESIVNNYAVGTQLYGSSAKFDDEIVDGYFNAVVDDTASLVTETELRSGKIAYLLGDAFGQILDTDLVPVFKTATNQIYGGYLLCGDKEMRYSNDSSALLITRPDHTWDNGLVTTPATCTKKGTALYTCTECGETKEESLPKTAHEYSDKWTSDDNNHWHECVCGEKNEVGSHNFDDGVVTLEPTEESPGTKVYTCGICSHELEEELAQLTHTHTFANTYTSDENKHWYASTCGHNVKSEEENHVWDEGTITKNASCTEEGTKIFRCTVCEYTKEVILSVSDHTYSDEWSSDSISHWHEATCGCKEIADKNTHVITNWELVTEVSCTTPELYEGVCETCQFVAQRIDKPIAGHSYKEEWSYSETHHWHDASCGHDEIKDYGVHVWDNGKVETEASCEEEGLFIYTCLTCQSTKEEPISATGHSFEDKWSYDDSHHWHASTCEHADEVDDYTEHLWDNGTIIEQTGTIIIKEYKCFCGATTQNTIDVTEHKHTFDTTVWITSDTHHWHKATCEHTLEKSEYKEHVMIWTEVSPATCSEPQKLSGTCETCGYEKEKIGNPATNHTYSSQLTFDEDYHWYPATCSCEDAPLNKNIHTLTWTQQVKPSCEIAEVLVGTCECGYRITKTGEPATDHVYQTEWTTNATHHWHEAACGHDVFPKDYAEHNWDSGTVTKETSCKEAGEKVFTCQDCQYTRKEEIAKEEHIYSSDWTHDITSHWYACIECGNKKDNQEHSFGENTIKKPATCTESGIKESVCTICEKVKSEVIPKEEHTYGTDWNKNQTHHWHECTCGDKSNYAEHTYGQWFVVTEPTQNNEGLLKKVCTQQGCGTEETKVIAMLSVSNGYSYTVENEPTLTAMGSATYSIVIDGQNYTFTITLPVIEESTDDPSDKPSDEPSSGLSGGAIAGIIVGSVVGAVAIAIGVFAIIWFVIKKKTMQELLTFLSKKGSSPKNDGMN